MRGFDVVVTGGRPADEEAGCRMADHSLGVALLEDRLVSARRTLGVHVIGRSAASLRPRHPHDGAAIDGRAAHRLGCRSWAHRTVPDIAAGAGVSAAPRRPRMTSPAGSRR